MQRRSSREHGVQPRLVTILAGLAVLIASCSSTVDVDSEAPTTVNVPSTSATPSTSTPSETAVVGAVTDPIAFAGPQNSGTLLGVSTGLTRAERPPRWKQLETDSGRTYDIGHVFHAWDKPIPTADDLMHVDEGRLLMISWNGTDTREIAAGDHDPWIAQQADAVRGLGRPVLLRWLWEMDGNRRRAWVHSGADYVAAWQHIRSIFDERGAGNAQFVWCPNEFLFREGGDPTAWYPGDDSVDWLCADGYNWAGTIASDDWVDVVDIFGDFYAWAEPRGKPIMIGEIGVGEAEVGAKAEWLRSLPRLIEAELPEIDALVYFDKDFTDAGHRDWRVDTSPSSYEAWIEISADPWFNPMGR